MGIIAGLACRHPGNRLSISLIQRFCAFLLVTGLLLAGAVPRGFMPVASADGGVEMVICHGADLVVLRLDAEGNPADQPSGHRDPADPHRHDGQHFCPFALSAVQAPVPQAMAWLPEPGPAPQGHWLLSHQTLHARLDALPPPSTGPPLTALA